MPVFNAENYIRFSIESILSQTHKNFEFLVIDDGSTDNSKKIIESIEDERLIYKKKIIQVFQIRLIMELNYLNLN